MRITLKRLELMHKTQLEFDEAIKDKDIEVLKIWNCKIKDYSKLNSLTRLEELEIFSFEGTLSDICNLMNLSKLRLIHMPKVNKLDELALLTNLVELSLESLPSWDSSGKTLVFDNFIPIGQLSNLKKLVIMKGIVKEHGLKPLGQLKKLQKFETDNTFSMYDFAWLSSQLGDVDCKYFKSYHEVSYSQCKKCGSNKVRLAGVTRNGLLCPNCNKNKILEHEQIFNDIVSASK